jgi:hypothetical protein
MAANEYYNSHPYPSTQQYSSVPPDFPATSTSYEPYHQSPHPQYPLSLSSGSSAKSSSPPTSDRSFLHPSEPKLKKSKSDRAIKFVEKQVKKQIEKKLHGGGGGQSEQGQQLEEHILEATQAESSGAQGGEYGYGDASGGYGASEMIGSGVGVVGDSVGAVGSGSGAGGDYGYGDASAGYGIPEGFEGNFDFGGSGDAEGFLEGLGCGGDVWESIFSG